MIRPLAWILLVVALLGATSRLPGDEIWSLAWLTYNYAFDIEVGELDKDLESGSSLGGGINFLRFEHLWLGADALLYRLTSPVAQFDIDDYSVSYRGGAGLRATLPLFEARLRPHLRAGGLYRAVGTGDHARLDFKDDGPGWGVGAGIEVELFDRCFIGPTAGYEMVFLDHGITAQTLSFGLNITLAF